MSENFFKEIVLVKYESKLVYEQHLKSLRIRQELRVHEYHQSQPLLNKFFF